MSRRCVAENGSVLVSLAVLASWALRAVATLAAAPDVQDDAIFNGGIIVQARVKDVGGHKDLSAMLEITEVLAGRVGQNPGAFLVVQQMEGSSDGRCRVFPPLKVGESGVWFVAPVEGQPWILQPVPPGGPVGLPSRPGDRDGRAREVQEWAAAVRRVGELRPDRRWAELEVLTHDPTPEVSGWAARRLYAVAPAAAVPVLKSMTRDRTVPIEAQVAADQLLLNANREAWASAPERRVLFELWVKAPLDRHAGPGAIYGIESAFRAGQIRGEVLATLMLTALANEKMSPDAHADAAWVLNQLCRDSKKEERDALFDRIAAELESLSSMEGPGKSANDTACETLAGTLSAFPLDAARAERIRGLLKLVSPRGRSFLQAGLEKQSGE